MQPISEVLRGRLRTRTRNKVSSDLQLASFGKQATSVEHDKAKCSKTRYGRIQTEPPPAACKACSPGLFPDDQQGELTGSSHRDEEPRAPTPAPTGRPGSSALHGRLDINAMDRLARVSGGTRPSRVPRAGGRAASAPSSGAAGHWSARAGCLWVLVVRSSSPPG